MGPGSTRKNADAFEHVEYGPVETYLSEHEHKAWVLTHVRGRLYDLTAEILEVTVETVKTYVSHVARKRSKVKIY